MKKFKIIFKSLLVLILTIMMSITSLGVNTNTISAGNAADGYDIEIYHGYGRRVSSGYELSVLNGSDGDYKFSAKTAANGYNNNGPSSGTTNRYDQAPQGDIASVDFYYGGQMLTAYAVTASGTNCIKSNFYLNSNGVLCKTNDNVTTWPSAATTKLVGFAASKAGNANSMASRWFNVPGDIKVVIHYHNEHTITVSGVEDVTINEDYDTYFTNKDATNKIMETIISNDYSNSTGITQSFEPLTENPLAGATITVGSNTPVNINGASGTYYLSSANTLSSDYNSGDILAIDFDNNEITYFTVNDDINILFSYATDVTYDVTFMVGNEQYGQVINVNEGALVNKPSDPEIPEGYNIFKGWYLQGANEEFNFNAPINANTTLYAEFGLEYKLTFNGVTSATSSTWADVTGGTTFEEVDGSYIAKTNGAFINENPTDSSGVQVAFNYNSAIDHATIEMGEYSINIEEAWLTDTATPVKYLDNEGNWYGSLNEIIEAGKTPIFKYAHQDSNYPNRVYLRIYNISQDITINVTLKERIVTFTNFGHKYRNSNTWLEIPYVASEQWVNGGGQLYASPKAAIDHFDGAYVVNSGKYIGGHHQAAGTVNGNYNNSTGLGGALYTLLEDLDKITFTFEGHDPIVLDCRDENGDLSLIGTQWHIDTNYELQEGQGTSSDILRWVINSNSVTSINFRFFKINENVDISASYIDKHTITFLNVDGDLGVGAYSNATSGSFVGVRCWDPYTSSTVRNTGTIDYKNGIATIYGNYSNTNGIGAALLAPINHDLYDKVQITYGDYDPYIIDVSTYKEAQISKHLYTHEGGILDNDPTDGTEVAVFVHNKDADYYNVRFYKIEADYTFEAKGEGSPHNITVTNISGVSSSTWASSTNGETFAKNNAGAYVGTTAADYKSGGHSDSDGVRARFETAIGDPETITFSFDDKTYVLSGEDAKSTKIFYMDSNGNVSSSANDPEATYIFKYAYTKNDVGFYIRFFNILTDINIDVTYSDYVDVEFSYNNEIVSSQHLLNGEYAEEPEPLAQEEGKTFMWYLDKNHTKLANPNGRFFKSTTLYGALSDDTFHHVYLTGLGFQYRSLSTPAAYLSSSTWVSKTGGYLDAESGYFVTKGDYNNEDGVQIQGRTSNYYVDKIEFRMGEGEPIYLSSLSSDKNYFITSQESGMYWFIDSNGQLVKRAEKQAGDILRFNVTSKSLTDVNVILYDIHEDIHVTLFYKMSMKVVINNDGSLGINVSSYIPKTVREDKAYVKVNDNTIPLEELSYIDYGVGDKLYSYNIVKLTPKQMADDVTIQFFDQYGNYLNTEKTVSVKSYLSSIIDGDYSDNLKQFAKDFLNYGGYAQLTYDYNTENLANADLSTEDKDLSSITAETLEPYKAVMTGSTEGVKALGQNLRLRDDTDFRVYFSVENPIEEYTFMDGTEILEPIYNGNYKNKPMYYVVVRNVAAPDLTRMHDISVKHNNEGDYNVSCGVLTYVGLAIRDDNEYTNPMKALYKLAISASTLKASVHNLETIFDEYEPYDGKKLKIAFVGDSITFGYGSTNPSENSYPAVLDTLLENKFNIGNFGMSGSYVLNPYKYPNCSSYAAGGKPSTSDGNKFYLNTIQFENSKDFNPDIVIIMEGTNDQRSIARYGDAAKEAYIEGLTDLINEYKKLPSVKKVYVMTSIVVYPDSTPESSGVSYNDVADGILCDLQIEVASSIDDCGLIDLHHLTYNDAFGSTNYESYFAADKLHPNDTGYRYIAETLADFIKGQKKQLVFRSYDTNDKQINKSLFYQNETLEWGADPTIIYISDTNSTEYGYYYLYATSGYLNANGIQAWRSKNLTDWECMGAAFLPDTDNDWAYKGIWAPSVIYNSTTGLYYLFYSAPMGTTTDGTYRYDSYATAVNPYGPFVNEHYKDEPMLKFEDHKDEITESYYIERYKTTYQNPDGEYGYMKAIGPRPFIDDDGQTYLFFCADLDPNGLIAPEQSCAYALKLDLVGNKYVPDYSSLTKITEYGKKIASGMYDVTEFGKTNEGPICFKYGDKYYLTFLTATYTDERYQTRLAVADNVLGPYTKVAPYDGGVVAKTYEGMQRICIGVRDIIKTPGSDHNFDKYYAAYMTFWNNESYEPENVRKFAVDELVPTTNDKNETIFTINGPSTTIQDLPLGISGYKNVAQLASNKLTITTSSSNSDVGLLNDGVIPYADKYLQFSAYKQLTPEQKGATRNFAAKEEYSFSEDNITITFTYKNYVDLRAVMVYNSKDDDYKFDRVDSITLSYKKNNKTDEITIAPIKFNQDFFIDGKYAIGGACVVEFDDIAVNKVVIKITKPTDKTKVSIPEIKLLGKETIPANVLNSTSGALYDIYSIPDQTLDYYDWKNVDSIDPIDGVKQEAYVNVNDNGNVSAYKGIDGVYIHANISDNSVKNGTHEIVGGRYNILDNPHLTILLGEGSKTQIDGGCVAIMVDMFNETFRWKGSKENAWVRSWVDASTTVTIKEGNIGYMVEIFVPYSTLGVNDSSANIKFRYSKDSGVPSSKDPSAFDYVLQ